MNKKTISKTLTTSAILGLATTSLLALHSPHNVSAKEKTIDIKLWVPTDSKDAYKPLVAQFEKDNKNVSIKMVESNFSKAQENVKKDPSKAADVFSLPHDQLGQLVESGILQELPDKYAASVKDNNTEQSIIGAQYKGKTYAFPYGIESQVLFYNKSKLNGDDVKSYESITEKSTFGQQLKQANAYVTAPLFLSVGDTLFGKNGEDNKGTNWGNEDGVSVLKWIADQNNNKGFVNLTAENTMSKFGDGSVGAFESGPWDYSAAEKAIGKDNLGIATYPTMTIGDKTVQQKAFLGVRLFAVNQAPAKSDTKRIAVSYKLAEFLTNADSQKEIFKNFNVVPSNKVVQDTEDVQSSQLAKTVITMGGSSDYTTVMPKVSQMAIFWNSAAPLISDTYNGKIKSSDYLSKLQQFDKDLAKAK